MPSTEHLSEFYSKLADSLQLSDTACLLINEHYNSLTEYLDNFYNEDESINIFSQGSYAIGTTIKPLDSGKDDFDVDFIINFDSTNKSASSIKNSVGYALKSSDKYKGKLIEKGRAWTITFNESHIDIVPSKKNNDSNDNSLLITDKLHDGNYQFRESNPRVFKDWFLKKSPLLESKSIKNSTEPLPQKRMQMYFKK